MTSIKQIEAALRREAQKLNRTYLGSHIFEHIRPGSTPGSNWTATFFCRGSRCPLDEMRAALELVQRKYPDADFAT